MANLLAAAKTTSNVRNFLLLIQYDHYMKYGKFSENIVAGVTFFIVINVI